MQQLGGNIQITSHLIKTRIANVDGQVEKNVEFDSDTIPNPMEHPDSI